jgi:hypothetical protein
MVIHSVKRNICGTTSYLSFCRLIIDKFFVSTALLNFEICDVEQLSTFVKMYDK